MTSTNITIGSCLSSDKQKNQCPTVRRFSSMEVRTSLSNISRTINQEQQQSSSANVDPTLFTSSDIILSRILPPTNNDIGNQQFVDFDLVDHDRTWWGYIDHHENWWSDVCWNDGVTLFLHSAVIPALQPTSCAATTLFTVSDIISLPIHRCSPAPI
jgi:hypothetical protein